MNGTDRVPAVVSSVIGVDLEMPSAAWSDEQLVAYAKDRISMGFIFGRKSAQQYYLAGRALQEVKSRKPRGEWLKYVASIGISETQSWNLVRIAETFDRIEDIEGLDMPTVKLIAGIKKPKVKTEAPPPPPPAEFLGEGAARLDLVDRKQIEKRDDALAGGHGGSDDGGDEVGADETEGEGDDEGEQTPATPPADEDELINKSLVQVVERIATLSHQIPALKVCRVAIDRVEASRDALNKILRRLRTLPQAEVA